MSNLVGFIGGACFYFHAKIFSFHIKLFNGSLMLIFALNFALIKEPMATPRSGTPPD